MKTLVILTLTIISLAFSATAQTAKQTTASKGAETILRIETENGKTSELKASDLAKLPRREVKAKNHDGAETTFAGVELREVLRLAGAKFGEEEKKSNLASFLIIEAADDYRAVFAMLELEPDFTDIIVLLADARDGNPLSKEEGSLRLVAGREKASALGASCYYAKNKSR